MAIKILVVEDDTLLNSSIVKILKSKQYNAFGALSISEARQLYFLEKPDIILLDIMLPDGKGYELLPLFTAQAKVLIMTALTDSDSKYLCYEHGAEDYLVKNFDMQELLYKIEVTKRNMQQNELRVGDIVVDIKRQRMVCDGNAIDLPHSQVQLLQTLYKRYQANMYLSKDDALFQRTDEIDESARIHNLVARLRKNIAHVKSRNVFIETMYGKGYRLVILC